MSLYKYRISIHVSRKNTLREVFSNVPYNNQPFTRSGDNIKFLKQKIVILAIRNGYYSDQQILERPTNSIYEQITKSLLYLYIYNGCRVWISRIDIQRNSHPANQYFVGKDCQPIADDFNKSFGIPRVVMDLIWKADSGGQFLRTVLTHYSRAIGARERYFQFERSWRAFEQLCLWHCKNNGWDCKGSEGLRRMRTFIVSNPSLMSESSRFAGKIGVHKLKGVFRWKDYIDNCFSTGGSSDTYQTYRDYFVLQYSDFRIMGIHKKFLPCRETQLIRYGYYTTIKNYIDNWLLPVNRHYVDSEVTAFLCCRYCYFLRNKMFHGEVADFTFRFTSHLSDDDAVDILNSLLQAAILDCIRSYNLL